MATFEIRTDNGAIMKSFDRSGIIQTAETLGINKDYLEKLKTALKDFESMRKPTTTSEFKSVEVIEELLKEKINHTEFLLSKFS